MFFQLAALEDVTGFNNINEGEDLIEVGLKKLRKRYSEHICEILRLMLKFEEAERPSFVELAKLVLTSEDNTLQSPNEEFKREVNAEECKTPINQPLSSSLVNNQNHWESDEVRSLGKSPHINSTQDSLPNHKESSENFMTQQDLFRNYVEANQLYVNFGSHMLWFEAGGNKVGKVLLNIDPEAEEPIKWKLHARSASDFHNHILVIPTSEEHTYFILGGVKNNCLFYKDSCMTAKANMPEKSFFSAVCLNGKIYTFGGFDIYDKLQLKQCEQYDIEKNVWTANDSVSKINLISRLETCTRADLNLHAEYSMKP